MKMEQKTHTHQFSGHLSGTTWVSRYQKGKTNLDLTEARDSEWQWHQLGHMQVCTLLQTDNHASTPPMEQKKMEKNSVTPAGMCGRHLLSRLAPLIAIHSTDSVSQTVFPIQQVSHQRS